MKVVFFGSIGIAKKILEEIIVPNENIELLGVVCEQEINMWRDEESVYSYASSKNIKVLEISSIRDLEPDLGISVRFNQIIDKSIIDKFRFGIVNTHGGLLPEYRGSYCNINALLNKDYIFGVTLHYIDEGIDTGDIVDTITIPIEDHHTGFDLYRESEKMCYDIIKNNICELLTGNNNRICQNDLILKGRQSKTYKVKQTLERKQIPITDISNCIHIIKAFDSPYHEPAYTYIEGKKIYLRVRF